MSGAIRFQRFTLFIKTAEAVTRIIRNEKASANADASSGIETLLTAESFGAVQRRAFQRVNAAGAVMLAKAAGSEQSAPTIRRPDSNPSQPEPSPKLGGIRSGEESE